MGINRTDRTVVTTEARARPEPLERRHRVGLGVAAGVARTAVMVALASFAILVLLPTAIAAQAASAI